MTLRPQDQETALSKIWFVTITKKPRSRDLPFLTHDNNPRQSPARISTFSGCTLTAHNFPGESHCRAFHSCRLQRSRSIPDQFRKLLSTFVTYTQKHGKMGSALRNTNIIFCQPFKHYISLALMAIHCVYRTREHPLFRRHRV